MMGSQNREPAASARRRRNWILAGASFAALTVGLITAPFLPLGRAKSVDLDRGRITRAAPGSSVTLRLPPPDLLRPLTPEEAVEENEKRSFAGRADTPATAFLLRADAESRDRALECLTQAIYYEAAAEGNDGGRAVAQVVLNRVRHPFFPSSVCGVVYEGSERPTGCQFTFTCDGSLARVPAKYLWAEARRIATEALAGKVFTPVGHATHYHADYVLPYWADSLDKSLKIGRHLFYRLKGALGASNIFKQQYAGLEPAPPPPSTTQVALEALAKADDLLAGPAQDASGLTAPAGELLAMTAPARKAALLADTRSGTLILDGAKTPNAPAAEQPQETCASQAGDKQLRPLAANDMRADAPKGDC